MDLIIPLLYYILTMVDIVIVKILIDATPPILHPIKILGQLTLLLAYFTQLIATLNLALAITLTIFGL
jgi:hypothetical protein